MLYSSTLSGDSLVQITPEDQKFIDYFYYADQQKILVKTVIDSDSSKSFSASDETNFLEMKLDSPAYAHEIFPQNLKSMLKDQIAAKRSAL